MSYLVLKFLKRSLEGGVGNLNMQALLYLDQDARVNSEQLIKNNNFKETKFFLVVYFKNNYS